MKIGFVGQGWIGKHYADEFESRGFEIVRYSKEQYKENKEALKECEIVFVAVPTPSTPEKEFDDSILIDAIRECTTVDQIVIIKSTIKIGTTQKMQDMFSDRYLLHSPEFLTEKTAAHDAANPARNIIGYTEKSFNIAQRALSILPAAPYEEIVPAKEAELVKYAGNIWFYFKVMVCNLIYDVALRNNIDYDKLKEMMAADKRIGKTHLDVLHQGGRGAGGHCFIKDMVAFRQMYSEGLSDAHEIVGAELILSVEKYNKLLLNMTGKDLDLFAGVYGEHEVINEQEK